jgi:hypothetical protein
MSKTLNIESDSLEEARSLIKSQIPVGFVIFSEKVISDGKPLSIRISRDTVDEAFAEAQKNAPPGATVLEKRVINEPERIAITISAEDKDVATSLAKTSANVRLGPDARVADVVLTKEGSKGFFRIGAKPNEYQANIIKPATVEVIFKTKANISVVVMKEAQARKINEIRQNTWWIVPGENLFSPDGRRVAGFLAYGIDGNIDTAMSIDKIEGSKVLIVRPNHKASITNNTVLRRRIVQEVAFAKIGDIKQDIRIIAEASAFIFDEAMELIRKSKKSDGLLIVVYEDANWLLKFTHSLSPKDDEEGETNKVAEALPDVSPSPEAVRDAQWEEAGSILDVLLIVLGQNSPTDKAAVASALQKETLRGRPYYQWITSTTRKYIVTLGDKYDILSFRANGLARLRNILGSEFDPEYVHYVDLGHDDKISGCILAYWKPVPTPDKDSPSEPTLDADDHGDSQSEDLPDATQGASEGLTIDQVIDMLVNIYRSHPNGIYPDTEAAQQVREIGRAIHSAGGMQLMLAVHTEFRTRNPYMGRNLEHRWDGIGEWMG